MKIPSLLIICLIVISCNGTRKLHESPLTYDHVFIKDNIKWSQPDSSWNTIFGEEKNISGTSETEFLVIQKKLVLLISTNAIKTDDDTVHLFWPPEHGGIIKKGTIVENNIVKSKVRSINNDTIYKLNKDVIRFKNLNYTKSKTIEVKWIDVILSNYMDMKYRSNEGIIYQISGP